MPQATVTSYIHQPLDVHRYLTAQGSLDLVFPLYLLPEAYDLFRGQVPDPGVGVYSGGIQNPFRQGTAYAVYVRKCYLNPFILGQVYSSYPRQGITPLK